MPLSKAASPSSETGWVAGALLTVLLAFAAPAAAQGPAAVSLGTADSFAVLASTTVTNTGPSVVNGNLGLSPGTAVTGFPPGTVNGARYVANAAAAQARSDSTTAYNDIAGRPCNTVLTGQDLGGLTLTPGVYCFAASAQLTGALTLDAQGNPNANFIFQIGSTLTTASSSTVSVINAGRSCNVYWQVGSSATLGTTTAFAGNILALTSISANTGATIDGRLQARNGAVTLDTNTVNAAQCATGISPAGPPGTGGGTGGGGGTGTSDTAGPTVTVGRPPTGDRPPGGGARCISRDFKLRVSASDPSGIRRTEVFLDNNLIMRTTRRRFTVLVRAERLRGGRHTIKVVSRDREGNRTTRQRRIRRCGGAVLPVFTG